MHAKQLVFVFLVFSNNLFYASEKSDNDDVRDFMSMKAEESNSFRNNPIVGAQNSDKAFFEMLENADQSHHERAMRIGAFLINNGSRASTQETQVVTLEDLKGNTGKLGKFGIQPKVESTINRQRHIAREEESSCWTCLGYCFSSNASRVGPGGR